MLLFSRELLLLKILKGCDRSLSLCIQRLMCLGNPTTFGRDMPKGLPLPNITAS